MFTDRNRRTIAVTTAHQWQRDRDETNITRSQSQSQINK